MIRLRRFGFVAALVVITSHTGDLAPERGHAAPLVNVVRFQGKGDRQLPTVRVPHGGTILRWTNRGAVFTLFNQRGIVLDSVASHGKAFLSGGRQRLYVVAEGRWTLTIPKAVRVPKAASTVVAPASTRRALAAASPP